MQTKNKTILIIFAAFVIFVACKSVLNVTTNEKVDKKIEPMNLAQNKELYANKCASCHKLFTPDNYSKTEWTKWVDKMAPKAKLTDAEKEMILALSKAE